MRGNSRRAVLTDEGQEFVAALVVRAGEHLAGGRQPLAAPRTVAAAAIRLPVGRIGAAQSEQSLLPHVDRHVVGVELDAQKHDVDVVEEIEIDVLDGERQRRVALVEHRAHVRHVAAPHDLDGAFTVGPPYRLADALAVEEALHGG